MKNVISNKKTDTVILALLEHGSIEKAAAALGVCDVTLWRWLKKPLVAEAYRIAKREAFARSIGRLQHAASAAVSTLLRVMLDKDASASSRVRAADCVLDRAASAFEMEDLDVRLMQLEEAESRRQKRPH